MIYNKGEGIAITAGDLRISYNTFYQRVNQFGVHFENQSGTALIFCENRIGWTFAFYAIWKNRMIPVPVDVMLKCEELAYILSDCKPSLIFTTSDKEEMVTQALKAAEIKSDILLVDRLEEMDPGSSPLELNIPYQDSDIATIIYTSGTTGKPKGVMLTFRNLIMNMQAVSRDIPIFTPQDVTLMLLPLHHILPLLGTLVLPLYTGGQITICSSMASEDILRTLQRDKVTLMIGVPRLYAAIRKGMMDIVHQSRIASLIFKTAEKINSQKFSRFVFKSVQNKFGGRIRYMVSGGAALDIEVARDLRTFGFEVLEGYGMTETAPMITFARPGKVRLGTPGEALPGCRVEIVNGEIVVSGENLMRGYLNKPQETAEVIRGGKLYTGDLGYLDKKGFLFITGRQKEIMVLSNGKNINPVEIEEQMMKIHPVVKEVGVFQEGDRIRAVIVPDLKVCGMLNPAELQEFVREHVLKIYNQHTASYKMVFSFGISMEELPKTRIGKIQRFLLKDFLKDHAPRKEDTREVKLEEFKLLKQYLEQEKKIKVLSTDHIEMDLGLDSLDKVSLQVFIESTFGIQMEIQELVKFHNLLELSEYIQTHKLKSKAEKINWSEILKQKIQLKLPSTWITTNLIAKFSRLFFTFYFRFKGKGEKNIPNSPCIFVANHQSFFDGLFLASRLRFRQMSHTYFYAKEKHVRNPFVKFLANRNNVIVMDLNHNLKESIQKMAEVLRKKKNLIIFPEGTRTHDGKLGDFKKTFAILSRELNVPVVPVTINGAFKALPRGSFIPIPFKKINVEFHKPVFPGNHTYDSLSNLVKHRIQRNLEGVA